MTSTWDRIVSAIALAQGVDPVTGRAELAMCWAATDDDDHAQRCVLAHYLADLEPDVLDEVEWDERALSEFAWIGATDLAPIGIEDAGVLAPSLHLNLCDGYWRLGRLSDARRQLDAGRAAVSLLGDDGYATMIRGGLQRLASVIEVDID